MTPSNWYRDFMAANGFDVGNYKPGKSEPGPPMDLANMRKNGVRSIAASCLDCHHQADIDVDDQPGHLAVPSFKGRMKCMECGSRRVDVRPAWGTRAP